MTLFSPFCESFSNPHFSTFQRLDCLVNISSLNVILRNLSSLNVILRNTPKEHHSLSSSPNNLLPLYTIFLLPCLALLKMLLSFHLMSHQYSGHPCWLLSFPYQTQGVTKFHWFHLSYICCNCTLPSLLLAFKRYPFIDI